MKRHLSNYATRIAERRRLRIFASDPMSGRRGVYRITVDVENEPLEPGPQGRLVEVVDYDASNKLYYTAVNLDDPNHLMEDGLAPNESDPRFHQQMVYAVTMRVIETASRALGRPLHFYLSQRTPRLRIIPHGFQGDNAFFDPKSNALVFGYFQAREDDAGPNIPGQIVYTCLSHDIVAHEMTHAIVHRLRRYFIEPTNPDVHAFHEGFSDIVAILVKFTYRDLVIQLIQSSEGRLWEANALVDLAQQFGLARGTGRALRSAYLNEEPDPTLYAQTFEPHARGAILLGAVFDGFFAAYQSRIGALLRIGGGGTDTAGSLHPDLVRRIADDVNDLADRVLRMCFRAFDYMAPVDVTFSDFLRALVTSDYTLDPEDKDELRYHLIEGFRRRGIYPEGVKSLAEESLLWSENEDSDDGKLPELSTRGRRIMQSYLGMSSLALDQMARRTREASDAPASEAPRQDALARYQKVDRALQVQADGLQSEADPEEALEGDLGTMKRQVAGMLQSYASKNAKRLGLATGRKHKISIAGFHAIQRQVRSGLLMIEFVVQVVQTDRSDNAARGGLPRRAGATIVFSADGTPRFVIRKPMDGEDGLDPELSALAGRRKEAFERNMRQMDKSDPRVAFADQEYLDERMALRAAFRALHEGHSS